MFTGKLSIIRPMEDDDQPFIAELNRETTVRQNVVGWDFPKSNTEQRRWFESARPTSTQRWIVEDFSGNRIGLTGLWNIDWHDRNAETALKLGGPQAARGRGIGPDVIHLVAAVAFYDLGLERLYSTILETNQPSLRAYIDKCGWMKEGVARSHVFRDGGFVDAVHIGLLRADFERQSSSSEYRERIREV